MAEWPVTMTCEVSGCGRVIHSRSDQFSLITIQGNVVNQNGGGKNSKVINDKKYVACASCTKKLNSTKFRRKNNGVGLD